MRRKKKGVKRLDFLPNRQNKYSIRKFTIGTASILVGATLVFGIPKEAKAAEENTTQTDNISTSDEAVDSEPNVDNTTQTPTTEPTSEEMNTDTTTPSSTEPTTNEQPSTEEPAPSDDTNASVDVTEDPSTDASTKEAPTQPSDATEASNESEATTETSEPDTTEEASTEEQSAETAQPETETTEEPPQEKEEADKTETNSTEEEATKEQSTSESNTTEEATTEEKTQETDTTSDSDAKTDASNKESNASTEEASPETTTTKDTDAPQTSLENDLPASNTDKESDSMTLNSGSNTSLMQALESVDAQEKQQATEDYLAQYLTPEESKQLINNTTINFENATTQEINDAILHEAAQNLANEMDQNEALATSSDIVRPIAPLSMQMNSTNYDSTFQSAMTLEEPNRPSYTIPDDPNYLYLLRDLGYNATTVKDKTDLRFAGIGQLGDQKTSEINLNLTKWLSYKSEFTDGGKVHLSFSQPEFFSQIDKITINGVDMTTTNNGQDWSAPISGSTVNSGLIGVVTNSPVKITLKNNQTLESLGYSEDNPVYMTHTWTTNKGEIAAESIQQTTITPTLNSKAPQQTQTSNFVSGRIVNSLRYDQTDNAIRSIHSFKPDENFLQTDYDWLLYIKEQVPEALIPYIDPNKIQIYVSDEYGNKRWDSTYVDITMDQNGLVDTSKIPSLSIMQNNTLSQIGKARLALDSNVFYGALGQSRNYTISYGLKDGVTMSEIARNINEESLTSTDARTQFSSWLESDYLDSRVFGKQDGGSAHKRIYGSYASSYIDFFDYDGDGVPDIADTTPDVNNDDPIAPDAPVINPIEAESTSITGTGESGSKVTVTFKDNTTATSTVDSNGQWTVNVPNGTTLNHNDTLSATLTDAAKNTSTATTATVKDTVAPNAVTINPVVTSDTTVTGANGEPGSTVTVTFPGGTTTTSTVGDHGNWEVNIPDTVTLNENDTVTATAQDKAGNQSSESTVNVTGIPVPDEPTLDAIEAGAQQISGKGEAGNTVTVTLPDQTQHTATVGDDGVWTIDVPDTVTLNHEDVVSARQNNGQQDSGDTTAIVRDTVAPNAPLIHDIEAGVTKITGQGENGSTITVSFPDGATANAVVDDEGNWTIDVPLDTPLPTLGEDITATSTDKAGNESQVSTKAVQDTTAPEAPGVLPIELGETTINGTGEPGATVEVTFKDGTIGTAEVGENGNWTLEGTADNLQLNDKIEVTQKDASQNVSHATTVMVHDTTAPDAPNVNPIEAASTEVTGTGEPNALIALQLPDGSVVEATANENGDWTAGISTLPVLKDGDTVEVTQRDAAMNTSTATTVTVEDTIAPDAPTINPVTSKDRQVKGTAEPNSTVVITFPNNQNATVEATEEGLFTVDFPEDLELTGGETIKAIAKDSAGNESEQSTTTVEDLTAPEPPVIASVNSTDTTINGTAEPGSKVSLTIDGETIGDAVEADQNGAFTFDIPNTLNGGEVIKATATDQNNNVSDETTTVVTDTTQPDVPTINPINSEDRTITGQAEANGTVTIELPEGETLEGTADENGNYTIDLPDTVDFKGGETIRASVKDEAGNVSPQTEMIVKDTTPPTTPTLNEITSEDTSISGTGEAGSTVTLTFPDGTTATGTVNDEGQYDIAIPEGIDLQGTEVISAESRDAAQNVSSNTTTTVKDVTPPAQPTIDEVTSNSIEISGTAEPNSKVTIVISDGTLIETNTNASGQYRENISDIGPFAGNESIEVTAIDAAGNTSEKATTTVIDKTPPDAPNVDAIQSTDNTIKGTAEPNSTVTVRFPDQSTQTATANEQGAFEFDITNQNLSGEEELVFTAKDESGNVSNPSSVVVADTTAPEVPTVDEVTSDATSIKGTGEAGSTVTVAFPGGQTSTGTVHEDGSYDLLIPGDVDLTGGEELQVTSTDKAGNESDAGTVTVTDTTAPA
ncbi:Ig-like domain-containing protein, partial [Staphylococcus sp. 11261D007BR]